MKLNGSQHDSSPAPARDKLRDALRGAISRSQGFFRANQYGDGYWWGRLESNPTMEAEYLMLSLFLGKKNTERWDKIRRSILNAQREDGSWGLYYGAPGDLSTSVECYFALKLAGVPADSGEMTRAREFILSRGGIPGARVFTKIWLALFGQWDWRGLPHMPPEMILVPPYLPFSVYDFASWARPTVVPMLILLSRHPTCPVPEWANLDELFPQPRQETDYSLPNPVAAGVGPSASISSTGPWGYTNSSRSTPSAGPLNARSWTGFFLTRRPTEVGPVFNHRGSTP